MNTMKIAELNNAIEAGLVDSILLDRSIPHIMRSYHDSAYDGLFQTMKGRWGCVLAPKEHADAITGIIEEIRLQAEAQPLSE